MKIFSAIFGSPKNTETIVDGAVKGLDKLFFTKEEKAEANQKLSDWYLKYLNATQPQNLARRLIAVIVVALWCLLIIAGVAIHPWMPGWSTQIFYILEDVVNTPFTVIIGFYFLAHVVRSYKK